MKHKMTKALFVLFAAALLAIASVVPASASSVEKYDPSWVPSWWTGYSVAIPNLTIPTGYTSVSTHARFLGNLKGSWHDIGVQYGERAGDLIRIVFDGWYGLGVSQKMPWSEIKDRVNRYKTQALQWFSPELLELVEGIAEGAAGELKGSSFCSRSGMSPYEMVLAINLYFEINSYSPKIQTAGVAILAANDATEADQDCSGVVLLPKATAWHKVLQADSKDQNLWPQANSVMYTMEYIGPKGPSGNPNLVFRIGTAGELAGMSIANNKGVTLSGMSSGNTGVGTNPYYPDYAFGVAAQFALAQACFFANNMNQAADILAHGSSFYRMNTQRKTVGWARSFNFLVGDLSSACVVETTPYRYAIRYPGYLGEMENAYIVSTNHFMSQFSYDANDNLTDVPLTQFGDGSSTTSVSGLNGSGTRFWTLMWLARNYFGTVNPQLMMDKFWTRDFYFYRDGTYSNNVAGITTTANAAGAQSGQVDTHCSIPSELQFYWTVLTPPDWVGPWDSWNLSPKDKKRHSRLLSRAAGKAKAGKLDTPKEKQKREN